ncbi:hypothetical protein GCM10022240_14900 [Microbacterium kribbense]|uniref:Uncharacterized protein n=1 Tax=Microbacterium kribbense TaxID=433645 RepID=A0ABP7GGN9_9MICO
MLTIATITVRFKQRPSWATVFRGALTINAMLVQTAKDLRPVTVKKMQQMIPRQLRHAPTQRTAHFRGCEEPRAALRSRSLIRSQPRGHQPRKA